jgi:hypothetical protein
MQNTAIIPNVVVPSMELHKVEPDAIPFNARVQEKLAAYKQNPTAFQADLKTGLMKIKGFVITHPRFTVGLAALGVTAIGLVGPAAAQINWTDINNDFAGITQNLLPDLASVIDGLSDVIVAVVVLIVVILIAMFPAKLLGVMLRVIEDALKMI